MSMARRVAGGTAGGMLGSAVMAVPILAARAAGLIGTPPPERITEGLLARWGLRLDRRTEDRLSVLSHLGFGAAAGGLYGRVAPPVKAVPQALALGIGYGTAIYAVSYAGWVPALGLLPPPDRDRPARQAVMLIAHWLFGATTALVTLAASRDERPLSRVSE